MVPIITIRVIGQIVVKTVIQTVTKEVTVGGIKFVKQKFGKG